MFARGIEQQHKGVDNVSGYTNMALVTGKIGRPKAGVATIHWSRKWSRWT